MNYTTYQISWLALPKNLANGVIKLYQLSIVLKENCTVVQSSSQLSINTTSTSVLLTGLSICAKYELTVRGYTVVGPGPYSIPIVFETLGEIKNVIWT